MARPSLARTVDGRRQPEVEGKFLVDVLERTGQRQPRPVTRQWASRQRARLSVHQPPATRKNAARASIPRGVGSTRLMNEARRPTKIRSGTSCGRDAASTRSAAICQERVDSRDGGWVEAKAEHKSARVERD
jgi:hypothetical protein